MLIHPQVFYGVQWDESVYFELKAGWFVGYVTSGHTASNCGFGVEVIVAYFKIQYPSIRQDSLRKGALRLCDALQQ